MSAQAKRRRIFPRSITIRAFLILFTILTICLAWQTSIYNRQARTIRTIRNAGGRVMHRWHEVRAEERETSFVRPEDGRFVRRKIHFNAVTTRAQRDAHAKIPKQGTKVRQGQVIGYLGVTSEPAPRKSYPFDFKGRWDVTYVAIHESRLNDEMITFLRTIPRLKYVEPLRPNAHWGAGIRTRRMNDNYQSNVADLKKALPHVQLIGRRVAEIDEKSEPIRLKD